MIHPGLAALEKWELIEYAAGYRGPSSCNTGFRDRTSLLPLWLGTLDVTRS